MKKAVVIPSMPEFKDHQAEIQRLKSLIDPVPQDPRYENEIDFDRCPTCGQVVGEKHKESIIARNKLLREKFEQERVEVLQKNNELKKQIEWCQAQRLRDEDVKKKVNEGADAARRQLAEIETRIQTHIRQRPAPVPDPGLQPQPPTFDKVDTNSIEKAQKEYERATGTLAVWNERSAAYEAAQSRLATIDGRVAQIEGFIRFYEELEKALDKLDEEIFKRNQPHYTLQREGYLFVLDEKGRVDVETPHGNYYRLSTGQRLLADAYICEKIAASLKNPLKFIFIDNADLVSERISLNVEQLILAYVTEAEKFHSLEAK